MAIAFLRAASAASGAVATPASPLDISITLNAGETGVVIFTGTQDDIGVLTQASSITGGGTWTKRVEFDHFSTTYFTNMRVEIWSTGAGGATNASTVSITHTAVTNTSLSAIALAYSGVGSFGATGSTFGSSTTPTIALTTTGTNSFVVGGFVLPDDITPTGLTYTALTGSLRSTGTEATGGNRSANAVAVDNTAASASSVTDAVTLNHASDWTAATLELKESAASATWTSTAATFYDAINEKPPAAANDADYIQSPTNANAVVVAVSLEPIPTPGPGTVSIFVRHQIV